MVLLSFVFGAVFGSFLNVLIDRLSTGRPFIAGRSYCESCKKTLQTIDLIPLLSYILLRGRCRYCHAKIPFRIFFVELTVALLAAFLSFQVTSLVLTFSSALILFIILFAFLGILMADLSYGIIPDLLVVVSLIASTLYVINIGGNLQNHFLTGLSSFSFFLFLFLITKGKGMGFGDVKLSFVLGFLLGFPTVIVAFYAAFLTGAIVSIILVTWKKVRFFGGTIPFGPFLILSTILSLFYGQEIFKFFLARFL